MRKNQQYTDWKKELHVWESTNNVQAVDKRIQAGVLFESLDGIARAAVLSELSLSELTSVDGVENIIKTLDEFFIGNETQSAYSAIDELLQFKCDHGVAIDHFILEFQLKMNKVKATGTVVSDGVLGYALLNAANLPHDKHDMIKATCDNLTYKNVKRQLEKIGLAKSNLRSSKFKTGSEGETSRVKTEQCYYGSTPCKEDLEKYGSSSDEDLNGEKVYYSENRTSFGNQGISKKPKLNPTDRFGHVRACSFCKCLYHWLVDCPYAPAAVKSNLKGNAKQQYKGYSKPL